MPLAFPSRKWSLQFCADPLTGSLFDNIREGICLLSYASMKGTPPINVTSAILERSQEMKREKMWILTNAIDPIFLRVTDDEGEK